MSLTIGELVGFIRADDRGFNRGLSAAEGRMRGFQRDVEGRLRHMDGRFVSAGEQMAAGLRTGTDEGRRFGFSLGSIMKFAKGLGGIALSFGQIAAKLGAALPVAAGLAATLANIAPAAGLAATGIVAMVLATQTLKLGMVGVGDAVKAALDPSNPAAFNEAIKKLAPNARDFAKEVKALAPELKKLQQDVQQRMFQNLDTILKQMGESTLPVLRKGLKETAGSLNLMALGVGNAAIRMGRNGTLGEAIAGATAGLKNLSRIPGQFVTGLTQVAAAAAPAFARLTAAAGGFFDRLAAKISKGFDSGAITGAIEGAIDTLAQLGRVVGDIAKGIGNIFKGLSVDGHGLFRVLESLTGAFADITATKGFQDAMKALSDTMAMAAKEVVPLLKQGFELLAPMILSVAKPAQELVKVLGAGISKMWAASGPVALKMVDAFGKLLPAIFPLIDLIADLVATITPALGPVFDALGKIFEAMTPFVQQLADNIGAQLIPFLAAIGPVLDIILPPFVQLVEKIFPMLTDLIAQMEPHFTDLSTAFANLAIELAPLIAKFFEFQILLLDKLMPIIGPLAVAVGGILVGSLMLLTDFITQFVIPAVKTIVALLSGDWKGATESAATFTNNLATNASRAFESLKTRGVAAIAGLASDVIRRAKQMAYDFVIAVGRLVIDVVAKLRTLPGQAKAALGNLGLTLFGSGQSLIGGFIAGILSRISDVANAANSVVDAARDFFPFSPAKEGPFSGKGWTLYSGEAISKALAAGITNGGGNVQNAVASMLAGAQSAMAGAAMPMSMGAGMPGMAYAGAGGAGAQKVQVGVKIEVAGPEPMRRLLRAIVQDSGGIEEAFGA